MKEYEYRQDWLFLKLRGCIPPEIASFIETTFRVMEIRERVGTKRGIKFEIRTKESNHSIPHVHAKYDRYEISIEIGTGRILAGNIPEAQQRVAVKWVMENSEKLLGDWNDIAITATSEMTKSLLD